MNLFLGKHQLFDQDTVYHIQIFHIVIQFKIYQLLDLIQPVLQRISVNKSSFAVFRR